MSVSVISPSGAVWDDPLVLLPRRHPQNYQAEETIYVAEDLAHSLYLVVDGAVKISRVADNGRETVIDFCAQDTFFGESCLAGGCRGESATAIEETSVMEWGAEELARIMMRTPELGPSMLRVMARKIAVAESRISSLATDQISQRLVKALLRLGEEVGALNGGTVLHIRPLTHELLAKYVGTSREIITQHMSQLRRKGLVQYSRAGIDFDPADLRNALLTS